MEFTPSPTVKALAAKNHINPRAVLEITDAVKIAVDQAIQEGAGKDDIFLAGFNVGQHMLSEKGVSANVSTGAQFVEFLTREYIANVTK